MRGDAPKGQGGVRITKNIYSPRPRFASATPLINEGDEEENHKKYAGRNFPSGFTVTFSSAVP